MNYLTNYYKNLSEQLQERVFKLEKFLNEANIYSSSELEHILKDNPNFTPSGIAQRAQRRREIEQALASQAKSTDVDLRDEAIRLIRDLFDSTGKHAGKTEPHFITPDMTTRGDDTASVEDLKRFMANYRADKYAFSPFGRDAEKAEKAGKTAKKIEAELHNKRKNLSTGKLIDELLADEHEREMDRRIQRDYEG
jgi:hypothetical protein